MLAAYLGSIYWIITNTEKVGLWLPITATTLVILSDVLDCKTTEIGISIGGEELNPHLPSQPTKKDLYSVGNKVLGGISVGMSGIFPPWGFARATDNFYLGISNAVKIIRAKQTTDL